MNTKSDRNTILEKKFDQHWDEAEIESVPKETSDKIYNAVAQKLDFNTSPKQIKNRYPTILKYAAVFVIGISIIGYFLTPNKNVKGEVVVENGIFEFKATSEHQSITLEDNSKIDLYDNSSLTYPEKFNDSIREVYLEGSALFDIVKNKEKPFIVHQGGLTTKVLGTTFTIENDSVLKITKVYLHTGKISVFNKNRSLNRILFPGDSLIYNNLDDKEVIEKIEPSRKALVAEATLAINGRISMTFVNVKIRDAYRKIQDKTGIQIDYSNIGIGGDLIISLEYKDKTVDKILKDLNSFSGYSYVIENNSIIINK